MPNWLRVVDEQLLTFQDSVSSYTLDMSKVRVLQRIMIKGGGCLAQWQYPKGWDVDPTNLQKVLPTATKEEVLEATDTW